MVLPLRRGRGERHVLVHYMNSKYFQRLAATVWLGSALDPFEDRSNPALKQRPVEAESQRQIAAFDHLVGLLRATPPIGTPLLRMPASARAISASTSGSSARPRLLMLVARSPGPITAASMPGTAMISSMRLTASTCSMVTMQSMSSSDVAM